MWYTHFDENQVWVLLPKALFEEPESGEEVLRQGDPPRALHRDIGNACVEGDQADLTGCWPYGASQISPKSRDTETGLAGLSSPGFTAPSSLRPRSSPQVDTPPVARLLSPGAPPIESCVDLVNCDPEINKAPKAPGPRTWAPAAV